MSNSSLFPASDHKKNVNITRDSRDCAKIRIYGSQNKLVSTNTIPQNMTLPARRLTGTQDGNSPHDADLMLIKSQRIMQSQGMFSSFKLKPQLHRSGTSQGKGIVKSLEGGTLKRKDIIRCRGIKISQGIQLSQKIKNEFPPGSGKFTITPLESNTPLQSLPNCITTIIDQSAGPNLMDSKSKGAHKRKSEIEDSQSIKKNKLNSMPLVKVVTKTIVDPCMKNPIKHINTETHYTHSLNFDPAHLYPYNPNIHAIKVVYNFDSTSNHVHTVASFTTKNSQDYQLTSENIANLIGQDKYYRLHTVLCALKKEYFQQATLSLLTPQPIRKGACRTEDKAAMTETTPSFPILCRWKKPRNKGRRKCVKPYILKTVKQETGTLKDNQMPGANKTKPENIKQLQTNPPASFLFLPNFEAVLPSPTCTEISQAHPVKSSQHVPLINSDTAVETPNKLTEITMSDNLSDKISTITGLDDMSITTSINNIIDTVTKPNDEDLPNLLQMSIIPDYMPHVNKAVTLPMPGTKNAQYDMIFAGMPKSVVLPKDVNHKFDNAILKRSMLECTKPNTEYKEDCITKTNGSINVIGNDITDDCLHANNNSKSVATTPKSNEMDIETFLSNNNEIVNEAEQMSDDSLPNLNLVSPEELQCMSAVEKKKMVALQMYVDWKNCLLPDEDNNLPIHNAVLEDDLGVLKRQCFVLKAKNQSIDIGDGSSNLSPLQMTVWSGANIEGVPFLLNMGADPLRRDDVDRSCLHLCAEAQNPEYMKEVLQYMANCPRTCLERADLWKPELEDLKQDKLMDYLFVQAVGMVDHKGLTPVMAAARLGHVEQILLMLERIVDTASVVDTPAPTSGNTALYLAVDIACSEAQRQCNRSMLPLNYANTIETLIRFGANPWVENFSGYTVSTIANDFNYGSVMSVINDALSKNKFRQLMPSEPADSAEGYLQPAAGDMAEAFILIKSPDGTINYEIPKCRPKKPKTKANFGGSEPETEGKSDNWSIQKKPYDSSLKTSAADTGNIETQSNENALAGHYVTRNEVTSKTTGDGTNVNSDYKQMIAPYVFTLSDNKPETVGNIRNVKNYVTSDGNVPIKPAVVKVSNNENAKVIKVTRNAIIIKKAKIVQFNNEKLWNSNAERVMFGVNEIKATPQVLSLSKTSEAFNKPGERKIVNIAQPLNIVEKAKHDFSKPVILQKVSIDATKLIENLKMHSSKTTKPLQQQISASPNNENEFSHLNRGIVKTLQPTVPLKNDPVVVINKNELLVVPDTVKRNYPVEATSIRVNKSGPVVKLPGPAAIKLRAKKKTTSQVIKNTDGEVAKLELG